MGIYHVYSAGLLLFLLILIFQSLRSSFSVKLSNNFYFNCIVGVKRYHVTLVDTEKHKYQIKILSLVNVICTMVGILTGL